MSRGENERTSPGLQRGEMTALYTHRRAIVLGSQLEGERPPTVHARSPDSGRRKRLARLTTSVVHVKGGLIGRMHGTPKPAESFTMGLVAGCLYRASVPPISQI